LRIRKDAHPESANGGGGEGFFSGLTLLYSSAPRAFHNSLATKRFPTLSQNRGVSPYNFHSGNCSQDTTPKGHFFRPFLSAAYTLFQAPYPVSPVFATVTKNCRVYTNNSHSGALPTLRITDHFSIQHTPTRTSAPSYPLLLTIPGLAICRSWGLRRRGYEGAEVSRWSVLD